MSSEQDKPNCDKNLGSFNFFVENLTKLMEKDLKSESYNFQYESPPQKITYQEAITIKNINKKINNLFREVLVVLDELKSENLFRNEDQYYEIRNKLFRIGNNILDDTNKLIEIKKLKGKKVTYAIQ